MRTTDTENIKDQMELFPSERIVVHYYDQNGALHSGHLLGVIRRGSQKGLYRVSSSTGRCVITDRIRNID
ncbi:MAG TPA: hypothetical protein ENN03_04995 [bacterium]|nr:hypothetical protein [bacterium]